MAHPNQRWLLDPTFPALPALPKLAREQDSLAAMTDTDPSEWQQPSARYPSGTWLLGEREEPNDEYEDRFATSDSEAPTVRPGALRALKIR